MTYISQSHINPNTVGASATINGIIDALAAVAGPTEQTTITGLNTFWNGAAFDGVPGRLRLGSSPYDFIDLRYGSALSKWVSAEWSVYIGGSSEYAISNNTTISTVTTVTQEITRNYRRMWTAGLKLQYRFSYRMWNDSSSFGSYSLNATTATPQTEATSATVNNWAAGTVLVAMKRQPSGAGTLTTTPSFFGLTAIDETAWTDMGAISNTADLVGVNVGLQSNASPANTTSHIDNMCLTCRWISQ